MTAELTPRQQQVLHAIQQHIRKHGYPPTIRELGQALGITSTNAVADALDILVRKGCLEWEPRKARGLKLVGVAAEPDYTGDAGLYMAARAALEALRRGDGGAAQALLSAVLKE